MRAAVAVEDREERALIGCMFTVPLKVSYLSSELAESPVGAIHINSPLGLKLGASFPNHPKHALKYAPELAIHWK